MSTKITYGRISPKVVTDGLVYYADFANPNSYPGSGTLAADLTGINDDTTLSNGPVFSSSNYGKITLDGIDDALQIPYSDAISPLYEISLSAWFYCTGASGYAAPIIHKKNTFANYFTQYSLSIGLSGYLQVDASDGFSDQYINSTSTYFNKLTHAVGTINCNTGILKLYIDGVLGITGSISYGSMSTSTNPIDIGTFNDPFFPGFFQGSIYNISIYNREISADEVSQNYSTVKNRFKFP